jgi:DNA primase
MEMLVFLQTQPGSHTGTILEHWRDSEHGKHLAKLALVSIDLEDHRLEAEFKDTLNQLEPFRRNSREQILAKMARGEAPTSEEKAIIQQTTNTPEHNENL